MDVTETAEAPMPSGRWRAVHWVVRHRTPFVVVPLVAAVAVAGGVGAQLMTATIPAASSDVVCWDGRSVAASDDCTSPVGTVGLQWVFPGFRPHRDGCRDVLVDRPEQQRPAMWECVRRVGGQRVTVTYIQVADVEEALRYFDRRFGTAPREEVATAEGELARYLWRRAGRAPELATLYAEHPYAVGIRAGNLRLVTEALRTIGFRHPDRISVAEGGD